MRANPFLKSACGALLLIGGVVAAVGVRGEENESKAVLLRSGEFVAAWNKHDAKAMAAVWADAGDLINPWGRVATGRPAVESLFSDEHGAQGPMRESTFTVSSEAVRQPSPDVAVSDMELTISGVYGPNGAKGSPLDFHVTMVWKKTDGAWSIFACRPYLKPAPPPAATPK